MDLSPEQRSTIETLLLEVPSESALAWIKQEKPDISGLPVGEQGALRVAAILHLTSRLPKNVMATRAFRTLPMSELRAIFSAYANSKTGATQGRAIEALQCLTGEEAASARRRGFYAALSAYPNQYWLIHHYVRNLPLGGIRHFATDIVWSRYPEAVSVNALLLSGLPDNIARSRFVAPRLSSGRFIAEAQRAQGWGAIIVAKLLHQEGIFESARLILRKVSTESDNIAIRFSALTALADIASPDRIGQLNRLRCLLTAVFISPVHVAVTSILREADALLKTLFPELRRTGDRFEFTSEHCDLVRNDGGTIDVSHLLLQSLVMPEVLSRKEMKAFRELSLPPRPIPCIVQAAGLQSIPPVNESPNPSSSSRFKKLFGAGGELVASKVAVTKFNLKDVILVSGRRHTTYFSNEGNGASLLGPSEGHARFLHRSQYEAAPPQQIDESCVSLILALAGGNYCHFLLDNVSRIVNLSATEMQRTILATPQTARWMREIVALADSFQRVQEIELETPYHVREVISFNSTQHPMNCGDQDYVPFYRALSRNCPAQEATHIYIQRPRNRRGLENEDEIHALLIRYGYLIVKMEDYDLAGQAGLMANAEVIIGIHGAGLSNIVFCQKPRILVELIPKGYLTPAFRVLAAAVGAQYFPFLEDISSRTGSETQYTDLFIEADRLEHLLAAIRDNNP